MDNAYKYSVPVVVQLHWWLRVSKIYPPERRGREQPMRCVYQSDRITDWSPTTTICGREIFSICKISRILSTFCSNRRHSSALISALIRAMGLYWLVDGELCDGLCSPLLWGVSCWEFDLSGVLLPRSILDSCETVDQDGRWSLYNLKTTRVCLPLRSMLWLLPTESRPRRWMELAFLVNERIHHTQQHGEVESVACADEIVSRLRVVSKKPLNFCDECWCV